MWEGLLPIGSVVMLKKMNKPVMIMGICQNVERDENIIFDYSGILYPQGYLDRNTILVFNREDITEVLYVGYMDDVQHTYIEMMEPVQDGIRSGELQLDEAMQMFKEMLDDFRNGEA